LAWTASQCESSSAAPRVSAAKGCSCREVCDLARLDEHRLAARRGLVDDSVDLALGGDLDGQHVAPVAHVGEVLLEHSLLREGLEQLVEDHADLAPERAELAVELLEAGRGVLGELALGGEHPVEHPDRQVDVGQARERFLEELAPKLVPRRLRPRVDRVEPAPEQRQLLELEHRAALQALERGQRVGEVRERAPERVTIQELRALLRLALHEAGVRKTRGPGLGRLECAHELLARLGPGLFAGELEKAAPFEGLGGFAHRRLSIARAARARNYCSTGCGPAA
jgi:hypothetical protein